MNLICIDESDQKGGENFTFTPKSQEDGVEDERKVYEGS